MKRLLAAVVVLAALLEPLEQNGVKATFFLCGAQMEEQPGVAEALVAGGHELGNHSWSHRRMVLKTPAFIAGEIEKTDALIRAAGYKGAIHFRAPYGKKLLLLPWYLQRRNRIHVTWDVEWRASQPREYAEGAAGDRGGTAGPRVRAGHSLRVAPAAVT